MLLKQINCLFISESSKHPNKQGCKKKHNENEEQNLCYTCCGPGNARKAKDCRDNSNNKKNQRPSEHSPSFVSIPNELH